MNAFPASESGSKRVSIICHRLGLTAVLMVLLTGCSTVEKYSLTYRVWDNSNLRKFSEPAPNPSLALFEATRGGDIVVQYDAFSEQRSTVQRRAYYLQPNAVRILERKKPKFIKPAEAAAMKPIPVFSPQFALTNQPPGLQTYAVVTKDGRGFTLYRATETRGICDLPVYPESSGTAIRIALTPLAVVGDAVVVVAGLAVVFFVGLAQSNASFTVH